MPTSAFKPPPFAINLQLLQRGGIIIALLILLPAATWIYRSATRFDGLVDQKSLHYAQVSRNIAEGRGITTSVITPLGLSLVERIDQHPDLWAAPVYTLWQAGFFKIRWASERVATVASGAAWTLMLWTVFFVANRRYGTRAAWLSYLLAWSNPYLMDYALCALPYPLAATLWLLFLDQLIPAEPQSLQSAGPATRIPWPRVMISALLATLAALTDYQLTAALLAGIIVYWSRWPAMSGLNKPLEYPDEVHITGDRIRTWLEQRAAPRIVLAALALMVFAISPWWFRNWWVGVSPWSSLAHYEVMTNTATFPGQSIFRIIEVDPSSPLILMLKHAADILRKTAYGLTTGLSSLIEQANFILLTLAVIALIRPVADPQHPRFVRYWLGGSLLFVAAVAMHDGDTRALAIMIPPLMIAAAGEFYGWVGTVLDPELKLPKRNPNDLDLRPRIHTRSPRQLVAMLMVALLVIQWSVKEKSANAGSLKPSPNTEWLVDRTPPGSAIISASPWPLAWQGGINSVWMPQNQITMRRLLARHGEQLPWIYFPRQRALPPGPDPTPPLWYDLIREQGRQSGYEQAASLAAREVVYRRSEDNKAP